MNILKALYLLTQTGVTLNMTPVYGRSTEGKRVIGTCPVSRGKRISTIGAISSKSSDACMTFGGTLNGELFLYYLSNFLCPELKKEQIVITDNARVHKVKGVKELIESRGAELLYSISRFIE